MPLFEPNIVYLIIRGSFRRLFAFYGHWNVTGLENIPTEGPAIIISNHTSYIDPPLMGSAVRRTVAYMAKEELFTGNKLLAWVCRKLESFPVKQGAADREAIRAALERLERGWMVGIFPEGHRSDTGELQEFQQGFGLIALKSRAPVIPCGVAGAFEMLPPHAKKLYNSHIEVHFGPALELEDLYDTDDRKAALEAIASRAQSAVAGLIEKAKQARLNYYTSRNLTPPAV